MQFKLAILGSALAVFASSAFAHQYDPNKPVTLTGTVKKIEWRTGYVKIHLDAIKANGKATDWEIQAAPGMLQSEGITRTSINKGDQITVLGIQDRKKGSAHALAQSITLANAQTVAPSQPIAQAQASPPAVTLPPQPEAPPSQPPAEVQPSQPPAEVQPLQLQTPPILSEPAHQLPRTATDWPLIGLMGLGALAAWSLLSISRARRRS
jgi:hypothetical protein